MAAGDFPPAGFLTGGISNRKKGRQMHRELLRELSVITEEEQRILDGRTEIDQQIYTAKNDMVIDSNKLLQRGKLIQVRPHTRFVHFPKHTHNYIEVIYMLGTEENQLRDFLVGALCGRDGETSWLYFHVSDILPVQNLVENMVWTIFYDSSNKRSCTQITMGLLFLQLLNCMDKMEVGGSKFDTEIAATVLSYIDEHYKNGSLSELAGQMGYDVYWLSREIRKRTGKTYKELLQEKRMQQAVYLLANSRIPVTDIIESVGYDNTSYFYRKFKEKYGVSPKEYRIRTDWN